MATVDQPCGLAALVEAAARGAAQGAATAGASRHVGAAMVGAAVLAARRRLDEAPSNPSGDNPEVDVEVRTREDLARPVLRAEVAAGAVGARA